MKSGYYFDEFVPDDAFAEATWEAAEQGPPELDEHFLHGKCDVFFGSLKMKLRDDE